MKLVTLIILLYCISGLNAANGAAYDSLPAPWLSQSIEYRQFLEERGLLTDSIIARLSDPSQGSAESRYVDGDDLISGPLSLSVVFIDATILGKVRADIIDDALFDLNTIYSTLPPNRYRITEISFCSKLVKAPISFAYNRRRARSWQPTYSDLSAFDYDQWERFMKSPGGDALANLIPKGAIPVVIVDGRKDLLGFTLGTTGVMRLQNSVVIDERILRKSVRGRKQGKFLAQLVANHMGLRSLWYPAELGGDLVDDTPQHNLPNSENYSGTIHLALAPGMPMELVDNVMDNTDDEGGADWTSGQIGFLYQAITQTESAISILRIGCLEDFIGEDGIVPLVQKLNLSSSSISLEKALTVTISPNPASEMISVATNIASQRTENMVATISIFDLGGKRVRELTGVDVSGASRSQFDLNGLAAGTYVLVVKGTNGERLTDVIEFVRQ